MPRTFTLHPEYPVDALVLSPGAIRVTREQATVIEDAAILGHFDAGRAPFLVEVKPDGGVPDAPAAPTGKRAKPGA